MKHLSRNAQSGFTLIELMIVVAIVGIVLAAITTLFVNTNKLYTVQDKVVNIQQGIRGGLDIMARDIRMAGLNPLGNATNAGFTTANATSMRVLYDYSGSGACDTDRHYQYDAANEQLEIQDGGGGGFLSLAEDIDSMSFSYVMQNGTTTANPGNLNRIQMVVVSVCGQISGAYSNQFDDLYCFNKTIYCRNMGL